MVQRIREKLKLKTILQIIPTVVFLVFVFYMMVQTFSVDAVSDTVKDTEMSFYGLEQLSDTFEGTLQENFYDKNEYINLNGLTARILGINSLNERQKLANGHLTTFSNAGDISKSSENVIDLNEFLSDQKINFLYLLAPSKTAFYDADFAPGYSSTSKESFDSMINVLNDAGVITIDMNSWYEENGWTMDDVFYKTDHHWKPSGALAAANVTMDLLYELGWVDSYRKDLLAQENYTVTVLEDWFLGSHGKRVGVYYAGVDDLAVYLPNFETDYTFSGLSANTTNWRYEDSPLNLSYMETKDYYGSDPHCTYLYGDQPLQRVTNTKAVSNKRVLVIGDSFRRTWKYFLTTQFQEIYSLDLRHYTDGSAIHFIEEIQPDIVIMCVNSPGYTENYEFGLDKFLIESEEEAHETDIDVLSETVIDGQEDNANNFKVVCSGLESNQPYTLTIDSTVYSGGEELYVQMTLQDLTTNTAVYNRYFDANSDEIQKWIFTTPENESDTYAIYLYAGTKGHTQNVSVEVSDVILYEGILEN